MSASRSCTIAGSSTAWVARARDGTPPSAMTPAATATTRDATTRDATMRDATMRDATLRIRRNRHFVSDLHRPIHLGIGLLQFTEIAPRRRPIAELHVGLNQHRQRALVDATDGEARVIKPLRLAILMRPRV